MQIRRKLLQEIIWQKWRACILCYLNNLHFLYVLTIYKLKPIHFQEMQSQSVKEYHVRHMALFSKLYLNVHLYEENTKEWNKIKCYYTHYRNIQLNRIKIKLYFLNFQRKTEITESTKLFLPMREKMSLMGHGVFWNLRQMKAGAEWSIQIIYLN